MHHGEGLRRLLTAKGHAPEAGEALVEELVQDPAGALARDHAGARLSDPDRALLVYAEKLTLAPGDVDATDVEALREQGFDDRAIHDACVVVGYYAFVNRIADGLGVELEEGRGG